MAPGEVGADEHDEIRQFQIVISSRHRVGAEGALVARDGGGHAEARVRVDIRRADKALHQLVGDVVVLESGTGRRHRRRRSRARARRPSARKSSRQIERLIPARAPAVDDRREQPAVEDEGLAERGALGAKPAEIGWMLRIAAISAIAPSRRDFSEHAAARPRNRGRSCGRARCLAGAHRASFLASGRAEGGASEARARAQAPRAGSSFGTPSCARLLRMRRLWIPMDHHAASASRDEVDEDRPPSICSWRCGAGPRPRPARRPVSSSRSQL